MEEKLLPIDEETGEIDYDRVLRCQDYQDMICSSKEKLSKVSTKNSNGIWVLVNEKFICRLRAPDGIEPWQTYFYMTEAYHPEPCKSRIVNDVDVDVYDMSTKNAFQGTISFAYDKDLDVMNSAVLYHKLEGKVTLMYSVTDIQVISAK